MTHYPPRQAVLTAAPTTEPLTMAEIKLFLRVDGNEEDTLLNSLTTVGRELAEKYIGKVLITQSWQMHQVHVAGQNIALTPAPLQSITSVKAELNGVQTTLDNADYKVNLSNDSLKFIRAPSADSIIIEMVVGYGGAEDIPAPIKQGILHTISHLYHNREAASSLCPEATNLWDAYCEVRL